MSTLVIDVASVRADSVEVNDATLIVHLHEGRSMSVPLAWYPRLWYGAPGERANDDDLELCRGELQSVLEGWVLLGSHKEWERL